MLGAESRQPTILMCGVVILERLSSEPSLLMMLDHPVSIFGILVDAIRHYLDHDTSLEI